MAQKKPNLALFDGFRHRNIDRINNSVICNGDNRRNSNCCWNLCHKTGRMLNEGCCFQVTKVFKQAIKFTICAEEVMQSLAKRQSRTAA